MTYVNGEIARRIVSGRRQVDIVARKDGLYLFHVHRLEDQPNAARWVPVHTSGLYRTYAECEADALAASSSQ